MDKRTALSFFLLLCCLYIPGIGRDFSTRGEAREALVAEAIVDSGNWVLPRSYSEVIPSKPPLMHWISAGFSLALGQINEITARLPSALCSILFLFYFFYFIHQRFGLEKALLTTLITALSFEWFRAGTSARVDMAFAAFLGAALIELFRWSEKEYRRVSIPAILFLSLATLAKGPAALVLSFIIIGIFNFFSKKKVSTTIRFGFLACLPAFLISSSWYLLAYQQDPKGFSEMVWYENAARFLGTQHDEPHKKSIWYLYGSLLLGFLPWTFVIIPFIRQWIRKRSELLKLRPQGFDLLCTITCIVFIVFFSIPESKRGVYLLPMYPFAAVGLCALAEHLFRERRKWLYRSMLAYSILLVFSNAVVFSIYASKLSGKSYARQLVAHVDPATKLYSFNTEFYQLSFYMNRTIYRFEEKKPTSGMILMNEKDIPDFEKEIAPLKPEVLLRSESGITKKTAKVALVKF